MKDEGRTNKDYGLNIGKMKERRWKYGNRGIESGIKKEE
jgi:hypothetical protein